MDKFALQDRFGVFTYSFMSLTAAVMIGWALAGDFGLALLQTLFLITGIGAVAGLVIQIAIMVVLRGQGRLPRLGEISKPPGMTRAEKRFLTYIVWIVVAAILVPVIYANGNPGPEEMKRMMVLAMGVIVAICVVMGLRIRRRMRQAPNRKPEDEFQ